jgi:hypothetical protein
MSRNNNRVEAFSLVHKAIGLLLSDDDGDLSDVEGCLRRAVELDPSSIEVLQEAAHFYDAILPNPELARTYATACRDKALAVADEMTEILSSN